MLEKRVAKIPGREVREKIVIEKSWKKVCYRNVGEECWKYWCKKLFCILLLLCFFLIFYFCWIPLLDKIPRLHLYFATTSSIVRGGDGSIRKMKTRKDLFLSHRYQSINMTI